MNFFECGIKFEIRALGHDEEIPENTVLLYREKTH